MADVSNMDDLIDSRDVIARIEELHDIATDDDASANDRTHANNELAVLQALADEAADYSEDWRYGAALVRDSYFTKYAREILEECGDLPRDLPHYIEIDWDATARNIQADYTSVDFDGVTYWVR